MISRCQRIKIPSSTKDSQAIWKTVIIMIESYEHEVIESLTSFQSIKGIMMRMTFNNEKTELNIRKKGLCHNNLWQLIYVTIYVKIVCRYIQ